MTASPAAQSALVDWYFCPWMFVRVEGTIVEVLQNWRINVEALPAPSKAVVPFSRSTAAAASFES